MYLYVQEEQRQITLKVEYIKSLFLLTCLYFIVKYLASFFQFVTFLGTVIKIKIGI